LETSLKSRRSAFGWNVVASVSIYGKNTRKLKWINKNLTHFTKDMVCFIGFKFQHPNLIMLSDPKFALKFQFEYQPIVKLW
jgi:hypothetical protein